MTFNERIPVRDRGADHRHQDNQRYLPTARDDENECDPSAFVALATSACVTTEKAVPFGNNRHSSRFMNSLSPIRSFRSARIVWR